MRVEETLGTSDPICLVHQWSTDHRQVPDDVAALVSFLAGPGSRNITGQAMIVDGGTLDHLFLGISQPRQGGHGGRLADSTAGIAF